MNQSEVSKRQITQSQLKSFNIHKLAKAMSLRRTSSTALHIFAHYSSIDENNVTQENDSTLLRSITSNYRSRMINVLILLATSVS